MGCRDEGCNRLDVVGRDRWRLLPDAHDGRTGPADVHLLRNEGRLMRRVVAALALVLGVVVPSGAAEAKQAPLWQRTGTVVFEGRLAPVYLNLRSIEFVNADERKATFQIRPSRSASIDRVNVGIWVDCSVEEWWYNVVYVYYRRGGYDVYGLSEAADLLGDDLRLPLGPIC